MDNYVINEQEREERERKQRELQAELLRNEKIIDHKADELADILDSKIERNTFIAKTFTDVSDKAEAIADKMYRALDMFREVEQFRPELKEANDKYEKTIHELESVIKELREKTTLYQNEADRLIAERKTELTQRLDKATNVPAYRRQLEQQEMSQKTKATHELER